MFSSYSSIKAQIMGFIKKKIFSRPDYIPVRFKTGQSSFVLSLITSTLQMNDSVKSVSVFSELLCMTNISHAAVI